MAIGPNHTINSNRDVVDRFEVKIDELLMEHDNGNEMVMVTSPPELPYSLQAYITGRYKAEGWTHAEFVSNDKVGRCFVLYREYPCAGNSTVLINGTC